MSDYFTNLLKESAEKTLSDIDSADAAQWLKNLSVAVGSGNPAAGKQVSLLDELVSAQREKTAAKQSGREGLPDSAFEKAYDSLLGKDRDTEGNPADEARQESWKMAEDLMKKAAVCQADHCKIPIPEIKDAGGYVGGSPNTATAGYARNMLYDMLTKNAGVDQKN